MAANAKPARPRWKIAEDFVLGLLLDRADAFENHDLDSSERGGFMPRMRSAVPGQHGPGHGIDIFAVDDRSRLWVIEVSIGTLRGAARFKGAGKPVRYAGGGLQMSSAWRLAAAARFLAEPDATDRIRRLLSLPHGMSDVNLVARFNTLLERHRKALIIPEGAHFDAIETDIDFTRDVYTYPFPSWFLRD
jgi:hypothetical protein